MSSWLAPVIAVWPARHFRSQTVLRWVRIVVVGRPASHFRSQPARCFRITVGTAIQMCSQLLFTDGVYQKGSRAHTNTGNCTYVCKDSAAPAHARTRAHRPAAPRQSSGVSQTPHPTACPQAGILKSFCILKIFKIILALTLTYKILHRAILPISIFYCNKGGRGESILRNIVGNKGGLGGRYCTIMCNNTPFFSLSRTDFFFRHLADPSIYPKSDS